MADNNTILDYGEIENLDEAKLQAAKKKFQDTTYTLLRDTAPITGELQSYKYAMQDAEALAKAARGEAARDEELARREEEKLYKRGRVNFSTDFICS